VRLPAEILSLAGARSADFGLQMLACDPVGARLPAPARRALVAAALDDGAAVGRALAAHHPGVAPDGIARGLGIGVVETDEQPWAGPLLRHAEYCGDPSEIRLFRAALEPLDRLLATPEACGLIGTASAGPVFLAHELYHHVEATREAPPLPRRHAVVRLRLGRCRRPSTRSPRSRPVPAHRRCSASGTTPRCSISLPCGGSPRRSRSAACSPCTKRGWIAPGRAGESPRDARAREPSASDSTNRSLERLARAVAPEAIRMRVLR
jgi:hypothetical protein